MPRSIYQFRLPGRELGEASWAHRSRTASAVEQPACRRAGRLRCAGSGGRCRAGRLCGRGAGVGPVVRVVGTGVDFGFNVGLETFLASFGFNWDRNPASVPIETEKFGAVRRTQPPVRVRVSSSLSADEAFGPDIQAFGAVGSAATGRDQTRCLSRCAEPSDHSVNGRSTNAKLAAHRFDDLSGGCPIDRLQQAA